MCLMIGILWMEVLEAYTSRFKRMCSDLWEREVITFHMHRKFAPHSAADSQSSGGLTSGA